jgi:hypothetical protein
MRKAELREEHKSIALTGGKWGRLKSVNFSALKGMHMEFTQGLLATLIADTGVKSS